MNRRCIVCSNDEADSLYKGILRCSQCGYVFANLDLSPAEYKALYHEGYFTGEEYSDYLSDKKVLQRNFEARLKVLDRYLDHSKHRALLEVGCAYGFFLELASKRFASAIGVDITKEGVDYAREVLGLNAINADMLSWDFNQQTFDVVCMWDTIEHLAMPDKYIERIASHMPSGGLLALTTGDIGSWLARLRKHRWRMIHPPTHLHYFSRNSLSSLLNRYNFEIVHFEYCGFHRGVDSIANFIITLRWDMPKLYHLLKRLRITEWSFYSNFFDIMYVIARRT